MRLPEAPPRRAARSAARPVRRCAPASMQNQSLLKHEATEHFATNQDADRFHSVPCTGLSWRAVWALRLEVSSFGYDSSHCLQRFLRHHLDACVFWNQVFLLEFFTTHNFPYISRFVNTGSILFFLLRPWEETVETRAASKILSKGEPTREASRLRRSSGEEFLL